MMCLLAFVFVSPAAAKKPCKGLKGKKKAACQKRMKRKLKPTSKRKRAKPVDASKRAGVAGKPNPSQRAPTAKGNSASKNSAVQSIDCASREAKEMAAHLVAKSYSKPTRLGSGKAPKVAMRIVAQGNTSIKHKAKQGQTMVHKVYDSHTAGA